jgi:hypothetical protein
VLSFRTGNSQGSLARPLGLTTGEASAISATVKARGMRWNPAAHLPLALRAVAAIGVGAAVFAYVNTFRGVYIDDAFISLQYVRELATTHTWGMLPGHTANTATSALNIILLSLTTVVTGSPIDSVVWLTTLELLTLLVVLCLLSMRLFRSYYAGVFAFVAFATNPLLLSTLGLESLLFVVTAITSIYLFACQRWVLMGVVLGLVTLTRAEGALLFALCLLLMPAKPRVRLVVLGIYLLVVLPWYLYAWIALGSFLPDTFFLKQDRGWGDLTFGNGLFEYWRRYPLPTAVSFGLLPIAILTAPWVWLKGGMVRRVGVLAALYGGLHFLTYSLLKVPPFHWYYVHLLLTVVLVSSLGLGALVARFLEAGRRRRLAPLTWATLLAPLGGFLLVAHALGFPFREPPIHTNWATPDQYRQIGHWLQTNTPPDTVFVGPAEVGAIGYYSDRQLLDEFSDSDITTDDIRKTRFASGAAARFLEFDLRWRRKQNSFPKPTYALIQYPVRRSPPPGSTVIAVWDTSSTWIAGGRIYLVRVSPEQ